MEETETKEEKQDVRTFKVEDDEVNKTFFDKCLIGEVKSLCYITKLVMICGDRGLNDVDVKFLEGLEVMMVFDTQETSTNILKIIDHGLRRWVHRLIRWSKHYIIPRRLTWVSIIGVSVSCWAEYVFKNIVVQHR